MKAPLAGLLAAGAARDGRRPMCADDVKMAVVGRVYRGPGDGEHGVLVVDRGHTAEELEQVVVVADDAAGGGDPEVVYA